MDLKQIQIDQEYFNEQQWYIKEESKKLFDPEKFIFLYTEYKNDYVTKKDTKRYKSVLFKNEAQKNQYGKII